MEPIETNQIAENILRKWLNITSFIQNDRIVSQITFNEALVCNHLMHQSEMTPDYLTPSELCKRTGIQKSLMNRTLKALNERNLIEYVEGIEDKRSTPIRINKNNLELFISEHNKNIQIVEKFMNFWGTEKTNNIIQALSDIESAAVEIITKGK